MMEISNVEIIRRMLFTVFFLSSFFYQRWSIKLKISFM
jgi:hypothetical protein